MIHVVKRGENLSTIANQYKVAVSDIVNANKLSDPNLILVGQSLVIPINDDYHIVKQGETLWNIAQMYGVSVSSLVSENQISNPNVIYPGQRLRIPKPVIETNGYLSQTGTFGNQIVRDTGEYLTYICMFSYKVQPNGDITQMNDATTLPVIRSENVLPLMTITNTAGRTFSSDLAHSVLSSPAAQDRLLANILSIMKSKGFRGLNIDFEYVYPNDKEAYNQFLRKAANLMHANNYSISSALAPKIREDQPGLLYEAHDYKVHGEVTDFVVLMTYEWGYTLGPPWAIAPINEVKRVLNYAVTVIPPKKILLGIPLYGRDWKLPFVQGQSFAQTFTLDEALNRAMRYRTEILYDTTYQSPYYYYFDGGIQHVVWFEDARSYQEKYNVIKQYGLRGASYWELNSSAPQNWRILTSNFRVRKLS